MKEIKIKVPATTANIGPGFDCLGAALNLYNQFKFALSEEHTTIEVIGSEAQKVSIGQDNLLYQSFLKLYQHLGQTPPPIEVEISVGVPLARGLGSSATAIIGGLIAANYFSNQSLNSHQLLKLAIAIEGHPDNVAPALLGNCILSAASGDKWHFVPIAWHESIVPVAAIPDFELSTEEARAALPSQLSYHDAVYNISRLGLLIEGLKSANPDYLRAALDDRLHQPYRRQLIKGYDAVEQAAIANGAWGLVISGAGPTLLALTSGENSAAVGQAMERAWQNEGVAAEVRSLAIESQGAKIIDNGS